MVLISTVGQVYIICPLNVKKSKFVENYRKTLIILHFFLLQFWKFHSLNGNRNKMSSSNVMFIRFVSDERETKAGFIIPFNAGNLI